MPGSALLSHGGPHYHRRGAVSLPRSGWDRVVPARHGRQAILSPPPPLSARGRRGAFRPPPCCPGRARFARACRPRCVFAVISYGLCFYPVLGLPSLGPPLLALPSLAVECVSCVCLEALFKSLEAAAPLRRPLGRCMAKPRGQLVRVSFTHYCASTPRLSTWWSSRALRGILDPREVSSREGLPA